MKRPKIEVANYTQVYDYYSQYRPNRAAGWLLRRGLSVALAPHVVYEDGAEEDICGLLDAEQTVVMACNQVRDIDRYRLAALPMRTAVLRKTANNLFILSRPPAPRTRIMRHVSDELGLVPIFHPADEKPKKNNARHTSHPHYKDATQSLSDTCIAKMQAGENMVVLSNTHTIAPNAKRIEPVANNVGRIICAAVPQPPIIPMGLYYPDAEQSSQMPTIFIGNPSVEPFKTGTEATRWLNIKVQDCLDAAIWHTRVQR